MLLQCRWFYEFDEEHYEDGYLIDLLTYLKTKLKILGKKLKNM
jgi:hypothetical protein